MKIAIRVDASPAIGSGHVMRCLALAEGLRQAGAAVSFICRSHDQRWIDFIRDRHYDCKVLDPPCNADGQAGGTGGEDLPAHAHWLATSWRQDANDTREVLAREKYDWLIVDHYALDWRWQSALRPQVGKVMAIDDLADRRHDCDVLLDSVCGRKISDYRHLTPSGCRFLLGTEYVLLRSEFAEWRDVALQRRREIKTVRRFLVAMGGVDQSNLTGMVLDQLAEVGLPPDNEIDVIVGVGFAYLDKIKQRIKDMPVKTTLSVGVNDMARRIAEADFGVGAFGVSTWERCCLGLPSINIATEENQRANAAALQKEKIGRVILAGSLGDELIPALNRAVQDRGGYRQSVQHSSQLVDGEGVSRVVEILIEGQVSPEFSTGR